MEQMGMHHISRAQRADTKEWICGYYCKFGYTGQEKYYIIPSYASACTPIEVIPKTVGKFTGLTDKNGKMIFEGDVVEVTDGLDWGMPGSFTGSVGYGDGSFRIESDLSTHYRWQDYECRVIGTIYDKE